MNPTWLASFTSETIEVAIKDVAIIPGVGGGCGSIGGQPADVMVCKRPKAPPNVSIPHDNCRILSVILDGRQVHLQE